MNDKELADAVVALGIGTQVDYPKSSDGVGFYHTPGDDCGESDGVYSKLFVRDWRVAGALMEMYSVRFPERDLLTLHMPIQAREIIEDITEALT